ncbi:MAG TPA: serine hydrolase domain-containing protein [Polyangia bacterium]
MRRIGAHFASSFLPPSFALIGLGALAAGCAARPSRGPALEPPAAATAQESNAPERLGADTTLTMPSGASLLVLRGWWLRRHDGVVTLTSPERSLQVSMVESHEPDLDRAVDLAWRRVSPSFALPLARPPRREPPSGGWEAISTRKYRPPAAEHRIALADARRFGGASYVTLIDGDAAVYARRGAELLTMVESWHPRGMQEESFAGRTPRPLDPARAARLDAFIEQARLRLEVPGAAVAVIAGGRVVYERTFGVRRLGAPEPITRRTLFMLGSITKPMTTLMDAVLIDAGRFAWDTPLTRLYPAFAVGDRELTARLTLWHSACACTGMPQYDLQNVFEFAGVTAEQRVASMRSMKPTTGLGETFQYSNLMLAAGGYAAAHAAFPTAALNEAYAATMQSSVFDPIGMTSTTVDFSRALASPDRAWPHALAIDGKPRALSPEIEANVVPIAPAGAGWSNLADMERYVSTELSGGMTPEGRRVVSRANLRERWRQRVRNGASDGYGLGMDLGMIHGLTMVGHTGGLFGFGTTMLMLPEQGLGIIVLTNVRNGGDYAIFPFNDPVKRRILEELFDGQDVAQVMVDTYVEIRRETTAAAVAGLDPAPDPAWVRSIEGTYCNPSLGRITISAAPPGGILDVGEWKSRFLRKRDVDGGRRLVQIDPPFAGGDPLIGGDDTHPTIIVEVGQAKHVFARTSTSLAECPPGQ